MIEEVKPWDDDRGEGEGKYGSVAIYDENGVLKTYAEDMPIFVLLGQDVLAADPIEGYADKLARQAFAELQDGDEDRAARFRRYEADVRAFAARLRAWQAMHPDQVKLPD